MWIIWKKPGAMVGSYGKGGFIDCIDETVEDRISCVKQKKCRLKLSMRQHLKLCLIEMDNVELTAQTKSAVGRRASTKRDCKTTRKYHRFVQAHSHTHPGYYTHFWK